MASKDHSYIYNRPAIRYTYLNLDAVVIFVQKGRLEMSFNMYYSHFIGHLLSRYRRISDCLYSIVYGQAGRYAPYRPA